MSKIITADQTELYVKDWGTGRLCRISGVEPKRVARSAC